MKILTIGLIIIVNLPNQFLMNFKMFLIIMMIFIVPQRRGIPSRFEKITPVRKQELKNTVEVRHTSSTARQGLSDPAAGISTLNGNSNISQSSSESSPQLYHLPKTEDDTTQNTEATETINAVIVKYGYTQEFLDLYTLVGAELASVYPNIALQIQFVNEAVSAAKNGR